MSTMQNRGYRGHKPDKRQLAAELKQAASRLLKLAGSTALTGAAINAHQNQALARAAEYAHMLQEWDNGLDLLEDEPMAELMSHKIALLAHENRVSLLVTTLGSASR